ncbi:MAG: class I SAM-dependent methyltransferase [Chitinophagaceae bacterium]
MKISWSYIKKNFKKKLARKLVSDGFYFGHKGYCPCCDQQVGFETWNYEMRETFKCLNCGCIPRERALMVTIEKYFPNWKTLSIHESSPAQRGTSVKLKANCNNYTTSQYYPGRPFGTVIDGHRNEDLEQQTFGDAQFDIVVTQDVLEHVYDPSKTFSEIARTLKPGGAHIFTTPLINKHFPSEVWATKGPDGNPIFTKTPEYHRNPVDPKGSPVTMHWGFDIVDHITAASGLSSTIESIDDLKFGIRSELIEVVVSRKKKIVDNE